MTGRNGEPTDRKEADRAGEPIDRPEDGDPGSGLDTDLSGDPDMAEAGTANLDQALDDPAQRLAEELENLNDRYLRLAAEFENFRKRTQRERLELSTMARADLARRLLPTLDDLARVSQTPPETTTVEALDAGLDLILRNLRKELEEAGLTRVEALGARFDPEMHQALMTADTDDPDLDDTVSRVFVDGYVFGDRLVRPAQVEVLSFTSGED